MVHNYMETLVDEMLREEMHENPQKYTTICQCPFCMARIQNVALNNLKPFYVTCTVGEVFAEYQGRGSQNLSDIMAAIAHGIADVSANPTHS